MRKPHLLLLLLLAPLLASLAFAQTPDATAPDVAAWFGSTAALAAIVAAVVAFLKSHVFKTAEGLVVIVLSLATGTVLAVAGNLLGYVEGGMIAAVGFGLSAGLLASGGWDAVTGLLGKRSAGA